MKHAVVGSGTGSITQTKSHVSGPLAKPKKAENCRHPAARDSGSFIIKRLACRAVRSNVVEEDQLEEAVRAIPPQTTLLDEKEDAGAQASSRQDGAEAKASGNDLKPAPEQREQRGSSHRNRYPFTHRGRGPKYDGASSQRSGKLHFTLDRLQPSTPNCKTGEIRDFPFKKGDTVVGTIIGGSNGWRVALDYDQEIIGFCPIAEMPHILKDRYKQTPNFEDTILGTRRNFTIMDFPNRMEFNGRGPRISARMSDTAIIWHRAEQMRQICEEDADVVTVDLATSNNGGLLGFIDGLPLFVPWSYLPRLNLGVTSKEDLCNEYVGKQVIVAVQDVSQSHNRFVGNIIEAMNNNAYHRLRIGDLLWGTVNALAPYGAFVTLDEFPSIRSLLHIASISQSRVGTVDDIFSVRDRVRCAVIGIDQEARQLALSTAELESYPGEMLQNKEAVFDHAEESIKDYLAFVEEQRQAGFPQDQARRPRNTESSGGNSSKSNDTLNW